MKKLLLCILAVCLSMGALYGQQVIRSYDDITGENILFTTLVDLDCQSVLKKQFQFVKYSSGNLLFKMTIESVNPDGMMYWVEEGAKLYLTLADGNTVVFENIYSEPIYYASPREEGIENDIEVIKGYTLHYVGLKRKIIKQLAKQPLAKLRLETSDGHRDAIVKINGMRKFSRAAELIANSNSHTWWW